MNEQFSKITAAMVASAVTTTGVGLFAWAVFSWMSFIMDTVDGVLAVVLAVIPWVFPGLTCAFHGVVQWNSITTVSDNTTESEESTND